MKILSFHKNNLPLKFWLITAFVLSNSLVMAQYSIGISSSYVMAFDQQQVYLQDQEVTQEFTQGYHISLRNAINLKDSDFQIFFDGGLQQLSFSGSYKNIPYQGNNYKISLSLGTQYQIKPKLSAAINGELQNNLDFADFRTQTSDLFRYNLGFTGLYKVLPKSHITLNYSRAFTSLANHYLIFNPINQVRIGFMYTIL